MKKNLVIGTLLISTILSATAPAMAGLLGRAVCNLDVIINDDPRCRDRRPGHRNDRRDDYRPAPAPIGGSDTMVVRNLYAGGQWVHLRLRNPVALSSVEVRGVRSEVRAPSVRGYYYRAQSFEVRSRGRFINLRGSQVVTALDVWVEARWDHADVEFTVYSDYEVPFLERSRR